MTVRASYLYSHPRAARRVRQGVEALGDMIAARRFDPAVLVAPDSADEVVDLVLAAWSERTGATIVDRRSGARVAQRLLVGFGQAIDEWYEPWAPEDIFWQVGLMQDYELEAK